MKDKIFFEWDQPKEYVDYLQGLLPMPKVLKRIKEKISPKTKSQARIQVKESGIHSIWQGNSTQINFIFIHYICFNYFSINENKIKIIDICHYEDLEGKIPDKSTFAISENVNIEELKKFFIRKGCAVEDRINV